MPANTYFFAGAACALLAACTETHPATPQGAVTGSVKPLVNVPDPLYPESMLRNREIADVDVGCNVDTAGVPHDCQVLSLIGDSDAAREVLIFVSHAHYAPRTHNGVPIPSYHVWHVHYRFKSPSQT